MLTRLRSEVARHADAIGVSSSRLGCTCALPSLNAAAASVSAATHTCAACNQRRANAHTQRFTRTIATYARSNNNLIATPTRIQANTHLIQPFQLRSCQPTHTKHNRKNETPRGYASVLHADSLSLVPFFPFLLALFSTTSTPPRDGASAGASSAGAEDPAASSSSSTGDKDAPPKGDDAGVEFGGEEPKSNRRRWKVLASLALSFGLVGAIYSGKLGELTNEFFERSLLDNLRKNGAKGVPSTDSWSYSFLIPNILGGTEPVRQLLLESPETLDRLIEEGLQIRGLESSTMGVSSEALDLEEMARANWLLTLFDGALAGSSVDAPMMIQVFRAAHARSAAQRDDFDKQWQANENHFQEKVLLNHFNKAGLDAQAELKEFQSLPSAEQKTRLSTILRSERPMTLLDILVQHGMHLKAKDSVEKFEEELKGKFWKAKESAFQDRMSKASESERQLALSVDGQQAERAKQDAELETMLASMRPLLQRLINEQVEKNLNIHAWSILRMITEPTLHQSGLLNGRDHAADIDACETAVKESDKRIALISKDLIDARQKYESLLARQKNGATIPTSEIETANKKIADLEFAKKLTEQDQNDMRTTISLRKELINKWLLPLCFVITSAQPGTPAHMAKWNPEASNYASELLGALVFDIPDLSAAFKRQPQLVQNALFSALANLAQVYAEGNYPGGAVCASELVLQCDPANVQILTTLAVEKMKLGFAEQMSLTSPNGTSSSKPFTSNPASNRYLDEALGHLKRAIELDPKNLDANFQFVKLLVSSGERDRKVLSAAADRLMKAIRESPTVLQPTGIAALPGLAAAESLAPLAETVPQLSPSYNLLIRTLEQLGRTDEAADLALEWSYRVHADALSHFTLGRLTLREGDVDSAEHALRTAYDLDPSKPETLYHLALARYKAGDLAGSEEYINQALAARAKVETRVRQRVNQTILSSSSNLNGPPNYVIANTIPNVHLLRAKIAARKNDIDGAMEALDLFAKEKPLATDGLILRAKLLQQSSKSREAYATFTKLLRVWQARIQAPVPIAVAGDAKSKKSGPAARTLTTKPATTRKAYFDDRRRSRERAIYEQLVKSTQKPSDKLAIVQWQKNMEEITEFATMCEEVNKLKAMP